MQGQMDERRRFFFRALSRDTLAERPQGGGLDLGTARGNEGMGEIMLP